MKTVRVKTNKWDVETVLITAGMMAMEVFGAVMLYSGVMKVIII